MLTLNIGLQTIERTNLNPNFVLEQITKFTRVIEHKVSESTYQGQRERTLVVTIEDTAEINIRIFCNIFDQECIALRRPVKYGGKIIFHANFKGKKIRFNQKYFLPL